MKEIREDRPGRGRRNTGSPSRPRFTFDHLEPRLLLSLGGADRPIPQDAPAACPLRIAAVGPIGAGAKPGTIPGDATAPGWTEFTPVVPSARAEGSASLTVDDAGMAPADSSTTYHLPGGATSFLVTLEIKDPRTQASWSVIVRDGMNREVGSVSVPRGQGGVAFEVVSRSQVPTGPITLTVAARSAPPGQSSGAYELDVAAAVLASSMDSPAPASTSDDMAFFFIGAGPIGTVTLDDEPTSPHHTTPGPGAIAAGDVTVAPPSGSIEPAYPKPTSGGVVRKALTEESPSEEQVADSDPDAEPTEQVAELVQGAPAELTNPAGSARQAVDSPGGLPDPEAAAGRGAALARRLAEVARPGTTSGTVVVSALLAAGLIVPNVLILGAPRFRPSRFRWRRDPQRLTSACPAD